MASRHGCVRVASNWFLSQLPKPPNTLQQHILWHTLNCWFCPKKQRLQNPLEDSKRGPSNSSGSIGRHHRASTSRRSTISIWYLDGATIGGPVQSANTFVDNSNALAHRSRSELVESRRSRALHVNISRVS